MAALATVAFILLAGLVFALMGGTLK